jgi:IclR family transcriptional regulator, pca regulon regulatory protein
MAPRRKAAGRPAPEERLPIASLVKSLRVLEALARSGGSASLLSLIQETALERTTVQRIVRTLVAAGYAHRTGRGEYAISPRAYVLGSMLTSGNQLAQSARPFLSRLQQATNEAVHMAVLDGTDVLCITHIAADKLLVFNFPIGARLPAYASSLGRAILAFGEPERAADVFQRTERAQRTPYTITSVRTLMAELGRVRGQGYAFVSSEVEVGVCAIAAPVLDSHGDALAAINVVVPALVVDEEDARARLVPPLLQAAEALSRELGWSSGADLDRDGASAPVRRASRLTID